MLKVNEPILVDDPDRFLRYERGLFEVVSPAGNRLQVVCPTDMRLNSARPEERGAARSYQWWRIKKVADA